MLRDEKKKYNQAMSSSTKIPYVFVKHEPVEHLELWEDENKIKTLKGLMMSKGMAEGVFNNLGKDQL